MLQAVGMTGRQVEKMFVWEGLGYSVLGLVCSFLLSSLASVTVVRSMGAELSYFTWHFTLLPVFLCAFPLTAVTALLPAICCRKVGKEPVVERLRTAE